MKNSNIVMIIVLIVVMVGVFAFVNDNSTYALPTNDVVEGVEGPMNINISIDGVDYEATLEDNKAGEELYSILPLEINMNELNGNEKFHYINKGFSIDPTYTGTMKTGDIVLFGNDCLVFFYKTFNTSYNYTKIGEFKNAKDLSENISFGDVKVVITKS